MSASEQTHESNSSQSPATSTDSGSKKRSRSTVLLDANGNPKPVKRRAAKACAACRTRKVRCDVMQRYHVTADGEVTCSNCTMDNIKCVIEESKRRKKHPNNGQTPNPNPTSAPAPLTNGARACGNGRVNPTDSEARKRSSSNTMSIDIRDTDFSSSAHVPHSIYQTVNQQMDKGEIFRRRTFAPNGFDPDFLLSVASIHGDRVATRIASPAMPPATPLKPNLPAYLKPLPARMTPVDIDYLFDKGALSLPETPIRNALLQAFLEFVHPYMPLVEVHELLQTIEDGSGKSGRISLLLFQAIMFSGTAFVDMDYLRSAGYTTRKAARKAFFQKARVLYDFDYEIDRVSLVQSLLLMTYWYETPDDQKDTWHWMGVAISLAHTIGLHRNPEKSNMEPNKKKLWKRIWWSCFMRDRLVALGMRRPTRVKDEDFDVPLLTEKDFEIAPISDSITIVPRHCTLMRDVEAQRQLAQMCIAKSKLCLCISHVLTAQYSVLVKAQGMQGQEGSTRSSIMLFPKKLDQTNEVKRCGEELSDWIDELPECCEYSDVMSPGNSGPPVFVQRSLLHMIYFTTLSALHRPQVLPSASSTQRDKCRELQDLSRKKVREASREITRISQELRIRGLEKYLPTTGVTALLPAIIIHLLDIKASNDEARQAALDGFCQCMQVLEKLRDNYASADFATQFLEAAIRKADIDIVKLVPGFRDRGYIQGGALTSDKIKELRERERNRAARRTPPPYLEDAIFLPEFRGSGMLPIGMSVPLSRVSQHNAISARTPPDLDNHTHAHFSTNNSFAPSHSHHLPDLDYGNSGNSGADLDMNDFLNLDSTADLWTLPLEQGAHGESGGFMGDMNWIDHEAPMWSWLNSPVRELEEVGQPEMEQGEEPGQVEQVDQERQRDWEDMEMQSPGQLESARQVIFGLEMVMGHVPEVEGIA